MTISNALEGLGLPAGIGTDPVSSFRDAVSSFDTQNLSIGDIYAGAKSFPRTIGGAIPEIGARIPEVGRIPLPFPELPGVLGQISTLPDIFKLGANGEWQAPLYAADLNQHQPKYKFLFKVGFYGFGVKNFYYFVHRCDKPKVQLVHQDVNYYNFRTRVLTNVTYMPLTMTFLDEIGNSVHDFFDLYMRQRSGMANGVYGIHSGFGSSSSSLPYDNGYSAGQQIVIEQIFANGTLSNRFIFSNPRIESFDFDELSMEESMGNMMTLQFSYDAIRCETVAQSTIYSWGQTDLLRGGGTSGVSNGGDLSGVDSSGFPVSANGNGMGNFGSGIFSNVENVIGSKFPVPSSIADLVRDPGRVLQEINPFNQAGLVGSAVDTLSSGIKSTLDSINSGANLNFGNPTDISEPGPQFGRDFGIDDSSDILNEIF